MRIDLPQNVNFIIDTLYEHGFEAVSYTHLLGENCSGLCKQGIRKNLKPCHRYCACNTWHRGICIFTSELIYPFGNYKIFIKKI